MDKITNKKDETISTLFSVAIFHLENNYSKEDYLKAVRDVDVNDLKMAEIAWSMAEKIKASATKPAGTEISDTIDSESDTTADKANDEWNIHENVDDVSDIESRSSGNLSECSKTQSIDTAESRIDVDANACGNTTQTNRIIFTHKLHVENLSCAISKKFKENPEIIKDLMRIGDKAILAADSKGGKSMLLIQLCLAIANGLPWLGFQTNKGRVLYINMELSEPNCLKRFRDVCAANNINAADCQNVDICNLRGKQYNITELTDYIIEYAKAEEAHYSLICIDPIYLLLENGECDVASVNKFIRALNHLAEELNTGVIYTHHHSKTSGSEKSLINRPSGSNVFIRDVDCLIDLIPEKDLEGCYSDATLWKSEFLQRDYASSKAKKVAFEYPIHHVLDNNVKSKSKNTNKESKKK